MAAFGTHYLFYLIYAPYRAEFPNKILFHHYRFNIKKVCFQLLDSPCLFLIMHGTYQLFVLKFSINSATFSAPSRVIALYSDTRIPPTLR